VDRVGGYDGVLLGAGNADNLQVVDMVQVLSNPFLCDGSVEVADQDVASSTSSNLVGYMWWKSEMTFGPANFNLDGSALIESTFERTSLLVWNEYKDRCVSHGPRKTEQQSHLQKQYLPYDHCE
jgi:hypothetical protein